MYFFYGCIAITWGKVDLQHSEDRQLPKKGGMSKRQGKQTLLDDVSLYFQVDPRDCTGKLETTPWISGPLTKEL